MGLEVEKRYRVTCLEEVLRVGQFGSLLKHVAPVNINPNGTLLRLADQYYTLPDGAESVTASGAALGSGIPRKPLFRGTGYDRNQHTYGDFGSDIYLIQEI